jgi:hypothetical protein
MLKFHQTIFVLSETAIVTPPEGMLILVAVPNIRQPDVLMF